tara:strand:- start:216 stop:407 length:192 start_codon:yes stop_codon:yes gene_type:complete
MGGLESSEARAELQIATDIVVVIANRSEKNILKSFDMFARPLLFLSRGDWGQSKPYQALDSFH